MRVLAAILITLFLMVGTYYYTAFADSVRRAPVEVQTQFDDADWQVEIFRTFACIPDKEYDSSALVVQMKAEDLLRKEEAVPVNASVILDLNEGIEQGSNELYVEANVASIDDFEFSAAETPHVLRVLLKRGSTIVTDQSFWLGEGQTGFKESVLFEAPSSGRGDGTASQHEDHPHTPNE